MAQTIFTLPFQSYASGVQNIPPQSVPVGATILAAIIDISQMTNPATSFSAPFEVSNDGGATWDGWASFTRFGQSVPLDRNGQPTNTVTLQGPLPQVATSQTRIRGTVTVNGPITIGGTIQSR